jgi:hypothetical protein
MVKEKLLILCKTEPTISDKYEELVCVAGITEDGDFRRIYPVPWETFFSNNDKRFKKKQWIEYELREENPSGDVRPESRKIVNDSIKVKGEASYREIMGLLDENLTTLEELNQKDQEEVSLGVIQPEKILDIYAEHNSSHEKAEEGKKQRTLGGDEAVRIDVNEVQYHYEFECCEECSGHDMLCEDWEVSELHRNLIEKYDQDEAEEKVIEKIRSVIEDKPDTYLLVGTHHRWGTYLIISLIYPKKEYIESKRDEESLKSFR